MSEGEGVHKIKQRLRTTKAIAREYRQCGLQMQIRTRKWFYRARNIPISCFTY